MYHVARAFLLPFFLVYLRLARLGRDYGKAKGGVIAAANHRSFLDGFVAGAPLPWLRPMNCMAKAELFERDWQGCAVSRVGAFLVRRGESDEEARLTARMI